MRKAHLLTLAAAVAAIAAVGAPSASANIFIAPAGPAVATSIGAIPINLGPLGVTCNQIINFNFLPGPIALPHAALPASKAATITLWSFANCVGGAVLVLGMPNSAPHPVGPGWDVGYNLFVNGQHLFTILNVRFLVTLGGVIRCLYQGQLGFMYNNLNGVMTLQNNMLPLAVVLAGACPNNAIIGPGLGGGAFQFRPILVMR